VKKASQSLPPVGGKKIRSFFTATCAWGKIPLKLPVWNFAASGKIMRAADCKPFVGKTPEVFSTVFKKGRQRPSLFNISAHFLHNFAFCAEKP
jgi:hypothetical protein